MLHFLSSRGALRSASLAVALVASATFLQACDLGTEVDVPTTATVRGAVMTIDTDDHDVPVVGTTVSLDGTSFSMATGESGGYRFEGVPVGTYTVSVAAIDTLNAESAPIIVSRGGTGYTVDFDLRADSATD